MENKGVTSIIHSFDVMNLILERDNSLKLSEIRRILKIPGSSLYRILNTLVQLGYLKKDSSLRYKVDYKILTLSYKLLARLNLRRQALPFMAELSQKTKMDSYLGVISKGKAIIIDCVREPSGRNRFAFDIGSVTYGHASSISKAILAYLDRFSYRENIRYMKFEKITEKTIGSEEKFRRHLKIIKEKGYAINNEETGKGNMSIGAPVFDYKGKAIAAVAVAGGELIKMNFKERENVAGIVVDTAGKISFSIGYLSDKLV